MNIEARDLRVGQGNSTQTVYFEGGLCAFQCPNGWAVGPVPTEVGLGARLVGDGAALTEFVRDSGLIYVGTNIQHQIDGHSERVEFWEPGGRDPANRMQAADSWSAIAFRAERAGDSVYANYATYLAVSMRMASLRLRDVIRHYHEQLEWAVLDRRVAGTCFSNVAMLDIYADFHSLASELASARDYLARIAAIESGAPDKVDCLARLRAWANTPANNAAAAAPMVSLILSQIREEPPSWLVRLGAIRNEMIHRVPMAASKSSAFLRLDQVTTPVGPVEVLRLVALPKDASEAPSMDPLIELNQMAHDLELLARDAWKMARYPAELPTVVMS
jgi:hypothetical protein